MPVHFIRRPTTVLLTRLDAPRGDRQAAREVLVVAHPVAALGDVARGLGAFLGADPAQRRRNLVVRAPGIELPAQLPRPAPGHLRAEAVARAYEKLKSLPRPLPFPRPATTFASLDEAAYARCPTSRQTASRRRNCPRGSRLRCSRPYPWLPPPVPPSSELLPGSACVGYVSFRPTTALSKHRLVAVI